MGYKGDIEPDRFDSERPYDTPEDLELILDFAKAMEYNIYGMIRMDLRRANSIRKSKRISENRRAYVA